MPRHNSNLAIQSLLQDYTSLPGQFFDELPPAFESYILADSAAEQANAFWFPSGVPNGKSVFLASSRLDQKLDEKTAWFDALRTFACRVCPKEQFLITASRVTSDEFATRIAELFQIPLVRFKPFPGVTNKAWFHQTATKTGSEFECYYLNPTNKNGSKKTVQADKDKLLIKIASQVRVLSCRNNSKTHKAVLERLADGKDTRLLIDTELTPKNTTEKLIKTGALAWYLFTDEPGPSPQSARPTDFPILQLDEIKPDQYLLHWTRRRVGSWPDQSRIQYIDDLIFGSTRANHDPLAALSRILATDRIIATNSLTRDPTPVVCLSAVQLDRLMNMTTFRRHLSRWDFLPYGLAINKQVLQRLGTRPVIYGDEEKWNTIASGDRPFFQIATSESGQIDWRAEEEWRLKGDLDLRRIGLHDAVVFVPNLADAEMVAPLSRWPVVVLADKTSA